MFFPQSMPPPSSALLLLPAGRPACRYGCYTDDTQMALALARSLLARGGCEAEAAAAAYVHDFQPHRGYGGNTCKVRVAVCGGEGRCGGGRQAWGAQGPAYRVRVASGGRG